jgi:hypothetical protein
MFPSYLSANKVHTNRILYHQSIFIDAPTNCISLYLAHIKKGLQSRDGAKLQRVHQLPSKYLPSRRFGYGVDEQHFADFLVWSDTLCYMVHDLRFSDFASRSPHNKSYGYLPSLFMGIPANKTL